MGLPQSATGRRMLARNPVCSLQPPHFHLAVLKSGVEPDSVCWVTVGYRGTQSSPRDGVGELDF